MADHTGRLMRELAPEKAVRGGLAVILVFFVGFGLFAATARLSGAVIATGALLGGDRTAVQHLEGGIVSEVRVADGQRVQRGDVLLVLHSAGVAASVDLLRGRLDTLLAKQARLEAERAMAESIAWPPDLAARREAPSTRDAMEAEEKLFTARRDALSGQLGLLQAQIRQIEERVAGQEEQARAENQIIAMYDDELAANMKLFEQKYVEKSAILALQRKIEEHRGRRGQFAGAIAHDRERMAEIRLRKGELEAAHRQEAVKQLAEVQAELAGIRERLRPQEDAARRLEMAAPAAGRVVGLRVHAAGEVIRPGETVLEIVPVDGAPTAEIRVRPQDISQVRQDQEARIQLNAYDAREVPLLPGRVSYVSADTLRTTGVLGGETAWYEVRVTLAPDEIPAGLALTPGMPVTAYLTTRERTLFSYLLEPLLTGWRKALRE